MKRIIIALLLCLVMAATCLAMAACDNNNGNEGDVVMAFLHAGTPQTSTGKVEAAFSEYVKEKLGFGVKFKQISVYDCDTMYTNWLFNNEEIDILNLMAVDTQSYINDKKIIELDSLLTATNAPYLSKELAENPVRELSTLYGTDGKVYGISVFSDGGWNGYSYMIRQDVLEECGLYGTGDGQYTDGQQITYSDLDKIFAKVKSDMPTTADGKAIYPCSAHYAADYSMGLVPYDTLGASKYPMAVMLMNPITGEFTGEVENYYASDEYKAYINWIGGCREKGYIHPDAALSSTSSVQDLYKAGQYVGVMLQNDPKIEYEWETNYDYELVRLALSVPFTYFSNPGQAVAVSSKSERPERAMQVIDLLWGDAELVNLLYYGIEGEEWRFVDEENKLITEASEGARSNYFIGGFWGDYSKYYTYVDASSDLAEIIAKNKEIDDLTVIMNAEAQTHKSPAFGFSYDTKLMNSRINNIANNICSQYFITLSVGAGTKGTDNTYTGPGSTYAEFIEKLNNADMGKIVADKQTQYNAWKEQH